MKKKKKKKKKLPSPPSKKKNQCKENGCKDVFLILICHSILKQFFRSVLKLRLFFFVLDSVTLYWSTILPPSTKQTKLTSNQ